jgi:hypothetical protein
VRPQLARWRDIGRTHNAKAIPYAAAAGAVVTTRQQIPSACVVLHARNGFHKDPVFRPIRVKDVAGYDYMLNVMFSGQLTNIIDGVEARLSESRAHLWLEPCRRFCPAANRQCE